MAHIQVFHTSLAEIRDDAYRQQLLALLPQQAQERIRRYAPGLQLPKIAGRHLLTAMLQRFGLHPRYTLADLQYTPGNKPFIPGSDLQFSISHSGQLVVCAGAIGLSCGIDTELIQPIHTGLLQAYFDATTWQHITSAADPLTACYREWVRREAVLKAAGLGVQDQELSAVINEGRFSQLQGKQYATRELDIDKTYQTCIAAVFLPDSIPVTYIGL